MSPAARPERTRIAGRIARGNRPGVRERCVAFFARLSPAGDVIYAGGINGDYMAYCYAPPPCHPGAVAVGIAVDAGGNAYVAGNTNTTDLPVTDGVFQPHGVGPFVARVRSDGGGLSYLTYIDNNVPNTLNGFAAFPSSVSAIAVDHAGNAYVTGATTNKAFPVTPNAYQTAFQSGGIPPQRSDVLNGFVAKLALDAHSLVWATYLGDGAFSASASFALGSSPRSLGMHRVRGRDTAPGRVGSNRLETSILHAEPARV